MPISANVPGSARRRSLGDDKMRPGSVVRAFFSCMMIHAYFLSCGGCRCEHILRIELDFDKTSIPALFQRTAKLIPSACA